MDNLQIEILFCFYSRAFFFVLPTRHLSHFALPSLSVSTMNNLLEKAKSMGKVVADSGAKTMLKVNHISLLVDGFCSTNESNFVMGKMVPRCARPPHRKQNNY